jgi:phage virion morphogenesis protein
MVGVSLDYDLSKAMSAIGRIQAALGDMTPLMEEIGAELEASTQRRFETHLDPGGEPWAELAARTIKQRVKQGYGAVNILRRTGALANSLHYQAESDRVTISLGGTGNSMAYAAIHQFGGLAGRGRKTKIPARPILGVSAEDEAAIAKIVDNYFQRSI